MVRLRRFGIPFNRVWPRLRPCPSHGKKRPLVFGDRTLSTYPVYLILHGLHVNPPTATNPLLMSVGFLHAITDATCLLAYSSRTAIVSMRTTPTISGPKLGTRQCVPVTIPLSVLMIPLILSPPATVLATTPLMAVPLATVHLASSPLDASSRTQYSTSLRPAPSRPISARPSFSTAASQ